MNLDNITHKVRENFESHIDHSQQSVFFQKFSHKFFKDFDIDNPFLTVRSAVNDLKDKIESNIIKVLNPKNEVNGLDIDPKSLESIIAIREESQLHNHLLHNKSSTKLKV